MAKQSSKLRKEVEHIYSLSDRLQVQLRVLEEMHTPVNVKVGIDISKMDVEDAVVTLMFQVSKSADDDLRAILQDMETTRKAREELREKLNKSKQSRPPANDLETIFQLMATVYAKQLTAEEAELFNDLDSLSEMSDIVSLRLQMMLDRRSKFISTLSNLIKKAADTANQITQNLK